MRKIFQNAGWLLGGRGVNAIFSLGYLALATRTLGLEGFGQFVLIIGLAQAVVGLATFQTWQLVVRWGAREDRAAEAVGFALALDILAVLFGAAGAAAALWLFGEGLLGDRDLLLPAFLTCCVFLLSIQSTPVGLLRLHDRYAWAVGAETLIPTIRFLGAALAAFLAPTIAAFLVAWALAEVVTAATLWTLAARVHRFDLSAISLRRLPSRGEGVWHFVVGTSSTGSLSVVSRQLMVLAIGAIGGAAMAGLYRVAAQIGLALFKLANSLLIAVYPQLVREPDEADHTTARLTRMAFFAAAATVVLAWLFGEPLVALVAGTAFVAAYPPMVALAAASGAELVGVSSEALLVSRGRALTAFALRAGPTLAAFASLPWVIPAWGALGAAVVVAVAGIATLTGLVTVAKRSAQHAS